MTEQRKIPTGFVAVCRCGNSIGATDATRTDREDTAKMVGEWLMDGYTVEPRFGEWTATLKSCQCSVAPSPNQ